MRVFLLVAVFVFSSFTGGASIAASLGLTTGLPALVELNTSLDEKDIQSPQFGRFDFLDAEPTAVVGYASQRDWYFDVTMFIDWNWAARNRFLNASVDIFGYDDQTRERQNYEGLNSAWGFVGNTLEFHFSNLHEFGDSTDVSLFGSSILVTIEMNFSLGADPFQAIFDNRDTLGFGEINVYSVVAQPPSGTVPVPAAFPLLLGALSMLMVVGRRNRS